MDRLPQEIYNEIGTFFADSEENPRYVLSSPLTVERPALATISRPWQQAIEKQTFRKLRLRSTDLDRFEKTVTGSRRRFLSGIRFVIILPGYPAEARGRFEREADREANDKAFTDAVNGLFRILRSWDEGRDGLDTRYSIHLDIEAVYSPTDDFHNGSRGAPRRIERLDVAELENDEEVRRRDLQDRRFQYSYIRLLRPAELPVVRAISGFNTTVMKRTLAHRTAVEIAAKLPNLRSGNWFMDDTEQRYPAMRRSCRHQLAEVVREVLPAAAVLHTLHVCMSQDLLWNHAWLPADLTTVGREASDPLGHAIREATADLGSLKSLTVTGCLDESLLWPSPGLNPSLVEPFWQRLQRLDVQFNMTTPSGGWYFRARKPGDNIDPPLAARSINLMPPGHGHSEDDDIAAALRYSDSENQRLSGASMCLFRWVPDEESLVPLIEAFGRVCSQMPSLKVASLMTMIHVSLEVGTGRHVPTRSPWGVSYAAPGEVFPQQFQLDPAYREDGGQRRLLWDVKDWQPPGHLKSTLGAIGRERYGDELVEKNVDFWAAVMKPRELSRFRCSYW
ncbi:hypothetical protein G7Z17_g13089 [Cylindrodendrum hubeiense]|uniref:F-box domain-containing protein n=1 Tax=Cylindrodendrum hubeiense TaxID=595255 RepID=A0A9P5GX26_9HYPO|nr:hypothetical protein G7Z17_g13089 [Cylindrodendrum hubeiense]